MTHEQQENIHRVLSNYYASTDGQRPQWREIASYVYANALRNPNISALEIKMSFEPLERLASSAGFAENAMAVGRALAQPVHDSVESLQKGSAYSAAASKAIGLHDDPLVHVKSLWHGVESIGKSAMQLTEHASGILSMQERLRLAAIYDLPQKKRLQALHGITLQDTVTMASIGSLPGLLPNAITTSKEAMNVTTAAVAQEIHGWPTPYQQLARTPALAGASSMDDDDLIPQLMAMATQAPPSGGRPEVAQQPSFPVFDITRYEIPDPNFDFERAQAWDRLAQETEKLSRHMKSLGLSKENKLIDHYLGHLMNVQVTQTEAEYQILIQRIQEQIERADHVQYERNIAAGMNEARAFEARQALARQFEIIQRMLEVERARNLEELRVQKEALALQQAARLDPDTVGYNMSIEPRRGTEREFNHHEYLAAFRNSIADLEQKLEILGLHEQANTLATRIHEMVKVRLEDSVTVYQQRVDHLMAIEQQTHRVDISTLSNPDISQKDYETIRAGIGHDLAHLGEEIEHDREYHIRNQLWQRQHREERRASDNIRLSELRTALFGDARGTVAPESQPER